MAKFDISGNKITFPVEVENERFVLISTHPFFLQINGHFDKWYAAHPNCYSLDKNYREIIENALEPIVDKGVEIINAQGVYSLNKDMFIKKYLQGFEYLDEFLDALNDMMERIEEIDGQAQQERAYRRMRKAGRGRVVGGGFGLGGAIKGMAQAGVMNAATGMAHSIGNSIGNMGTSIAASSSRSAVYKNAKEPLRSALFQCADNILSGIRKALENEARIKCKCVTALEYDKARAILTNYQQNRIPEEHKQTQIIEALQTFPYDFEIYCTIWEDYGDQNGELRKMASYFGVKLEDYTNNLAKKYGDNLYEKVCSPYENAWNKREMGMQIEGEIKDALESMLQYCESHDVAESAVPVIGKCKKILEDIDSEAKTFRGITYDTRELAVNIKKDYETFYNALIGKDIFDDSTYEQVRSNDYITKEFVDNFDTTFKIERQKRTTDKIFENLSGLVMETLEDRYYNGWIDIPSYIGSLNMKEAMIRTITGMPMDEVALVLFDKSSNGKSGVLITNHFFRIYSKGLLASLNENQAYPIEMIQKIECPANDEYILYIDGQEPVKFNFKNKNMDAEEQIKTAELVTELVKIVNNLPPGHRIGLYRALHGVVRCNCGMNLIVGEKICPSCKRIMNVEGEFVESQICPDCGNYVIKGKKFCPSCGRTLIEADNLRSISVSCKDVPNQADSIKTEQIPDIRKCPQCGNEVKNGRKFCIYCGNDLSVSENSNQESFVTDQVNSQIALLEEQSVLAIKICVQCGNKIKVEKKFCSKCGAKV